jgi:chromosome segregation ATPase
MPIKIEALNTCADMIRGNPRLQEGFAQEQVRPFVQPTSNGTTTPNGMSTVYVIEALLNLVLTPAPNELFDLRNAACECVRSYFYNHMQIREHFLNRAIGGHEEGDETANALTILMAGPQASPASDPYRLWFASTLIYHLIVGDLRAKDTLMQVKEGDAESGEEVVTCIQTLTANLITSLQLGEDERISIAYLMLLLEWLYEDAAAVDDFLGEASSLQSLVQATLTPGDDRVIIRGLCAALLGVVYEFSTRDSPVPRRELQPVLTSKLGREKYLDAISELRQHPFVRDFEVLPRTGGGSGSMPDIYFDEMFIDFLKDNFSRLTRAVDRNPNIEQHQSHDGVGERNEKEQTIQELKSQLMTLEQKLDQESADHRKTQQAADEQRNTLKKINDKLHDDIDKEAAKKDREHRQATLELENRYNLQIVALNNKLQQAAKESTLAISRTKQEYDERLHESNRTRSEAEQRLQMADKARREALETIRNLEQTQQQTRAELSTITETLRNLQKHVQDSEAQVKGLKEDKEALQSSIDKLKAEDQAAIDKLKAENQAAFDKLKAENQELKTKIQDQTWKVKDAEDTLRKAEATTKGAQDGKEKELKTLQEKLRDAEKSTEEKQTELDDLFVILGDLEEKRSKDKVHLFIRLFYIT